MFDKEQMYCGVKSLLFYFIFKKSLHNFNLFSWLSRQSAATLALFNTLLSIGIIVIVIVRLSIVIYNLTIL